MPEQLGKYLLLDRINQGGMAEVYLAKAFGFGGTDQIIAVKRILHSISADPAFVEMFVNEAKLAVLLNHANIAQIFELGHADSAYFIAMEYVPGRDLRAMIDRASHHGIELPEHLVLYIVTQMLEGLDFAHRKSHPSGKALGIVHRDISPHNVLISYTGAVKLIDFGIAKMASEDTDGKGKVLRGKYGYMSPEQVMGQSVDPRTDIFATGIVLWEMLTQQRLFAGGSDFSVLEKVRYAEVYPPSLLSPKVSLELEEVVVKALSADRDRRYASASDMQDAVVEIMLQKHGHPTQRELANLMKSLFAREHMADLKRLEKARDYEQAKDRGLPDRSIHVTRSKNVVDARLTTDDGEDTEPGRNSLITPDDTDPSIDAIVDGGQEAQRVVTEPHMRIDGVTTEAVKVKIPDYFEPLSEVGRRPVGEPTAKSIHLGARIGSPRAGGTRSSGKIRRGQVRVSRAETTGSKLRPGRLEPTRTKTPAEMAEFRGQVPATQIRPIPRASQITRDHLIVAGAVVIAVLIVVVSWLATRGGQVEQTGEVRIMSVPHGAVVILDGLVVGRTPYSATGIAVGRHTVTWERPGFISETRVIDVVPNDMVPVQMVLKPVLSKKKVPPDP